MKLRTAFWLLAALLLIGFGISYISITEGDVKEGETECLTDVEIREKKGIDPDKARTVLLMQRIQNDNARGTQDEMEQRMRELADEVDRMPCLEFKKTVSFEEAHRSHFWGFLMILGALGIPIWWFRKQRSLKTRPKPPFLPGAAPDVREGVLEPQLQLSMEDSVQRMMAVYQRTQDMKDYEGLDLKVHEYERRYGRLPEVYLRSAGILAAGLIDRYKKTHDEKLVAQIQYLKQLIAQDKPPTS